MKKKIYALIKNVLVLLIIGVPQLYLVIKDKPWQVNMIILISTTVILFFWNLEKITELTLKKDGLSIRLKQAVEEAYATIDFIKETVAPIFKLQTNLIKTSGTFSVMSTKQYIEIIKELQVVATSLGLDDEADRLEFETIPRLYTSARDELYDYCSKLLNVEEYELRQRISESEESELANFKRISKEKGNEYDHERINFLISVYEKSTRRMLDEARMFDNE